MSTPKPTIKTKVRQRPVAHQASTVETTKVRVRAVRIGFADNVRRRVGDVFTLAVPVVNNEAEIPSWCEPAAGAALQQTGAQAALNDATAEIRALGGTAAAAPSASSGDDLGI